MELRDIIQELDKPNNSGKPDYDTSDLKGLQSTTINNFTYHLGESILTDSPNFNNSFIIYIGTNFIVINNSINYPNFRIIKNENIDNIIIKAEFFQKENEITRIKHKELKCLNTKFIQEIE